MVHLATPEYTLSQLHPIIYFHTDRLVFKTQYMLMWYQELRFGNCPLGVVTRKRIFLLA